MTDAIRATLDHEDTVLESCLTKLSESLGKCYPQDEVRRSDYRKRIESYQAATYYAKPCALSPIILARFGFENVRRDVIQCVSCRACVAIVFHSQLSKHATDCLISWYESQVAESHTLACPYRRQAIEYFARTEKDQEQSSNKKSSTQSVLPPAWKVLAGFLPSTEVELLEEIPTRAFAKLVEEILNHTRSSFCLDTLRNIPQNILFYGKEQLPEANTSRLSLFSHMANKLRLPGMAEGQEEDLQDKDAETAILLTLFGWRLNRESQKNTATGGNESPPNCRTVFKCNLCLSLFDFTTKESTTTESDGLQCTTSPRTAVTKNLMDRTPWNAHRYYCPYVSGFVVYHPNREDESKITGRSMSKPLWQLIADKFLLAEEGAEKSANCSTESANCSTEIVETTRNQFPKKGVQDNPQPSAWMRTHQLLMDAISKRGANRAIGIGKNDISSNKRRRLDS